VIFDCDFLLAAIITHIQQRQLNPSENFLPFHWLIFIIAHFPLAGWGTQGKVYQYGQFSKHISDRRLQVISMKHVKSFAF
jgi:hypothetical protein